MGDEAPNSKSKGPPHLGLSVLAYQAVLLCIGIVMAFESAYYADPILSTIGEGAWLWTIVNALFLATLSAPLFWPVGAIVVAILAGMVLSLWTLSGWLRWSCFMTLMVALNVCSLYGAARVD